MRLTVPVVNSRMTGFIAMFASVAATMLPGTAAAKSALSEIVVIGRTPLLGPETDVDKVPAETHVLDADDLARQGAPDVLGALRDQVPGLHLDDSSGNPDQPTLFYHGFAASPLQGTERLAR